MIRVYLGTMDGLGWSQSGVLSCVGVVVAFAEAQ